MNIRIHKIIAFIFISLLAAFIILPAPVSHAAATRGQLKLVKGKWYKGSSGFADYYYTFTKKYCRQHNYKNGKVLSKDKIVSIRKSGNNYIFNMKGKGYKYWYTGKLEKRKIKNLEFHWREDGEQHYSGGSSLFRENVWH